MIFEVPFLVKFQNNLQTRLVFSIHVSTSLLVLALTFQIDQHGQFQLNQFAFYDFSWHVVDMKATLL